MVPRKVSLWIASPFAFVRIWIRSVPLGLIVIGWPAIM